MGVQQIYYFRTVRSITYKGNVGLQSIIVNGSGFEQ